MTLGFLNLPLKLSLSERIVVFALLATALLSAFTGWLFQIYTNTICHQKLLLTFLLSTLFWVGMVPYISKRDSLLKVRKRTLFKDISRSAGMGLGLVLVNQILIVLSVGLFFKMVYNCEVFGGWSEELIINNFTANIFSFGLIFAFVQWNSFQEKQTESNGSMSSSFSQNIWIKDYSQQTRLPIQKIIWVHADNNCIHVHTEQRKYVIYRSLKSLEQELDPSQFVRIHRSKIVNRDHITQLNSFPSGDGEITLNTGERLRYSRTFKGALLL